MSDNFGIGGNRGSAGLWLLSSQNSACERFDETGGLLTGGRRTLRSWVPSFGLCKRVVLNVKICLWELITSKESFPTNFIWCVFSRSLVALDDASPTGAQFAPLAGGGRFSFFTTTGGMAASSLATSANIHARSGFIVSTNAVGGMSGAEAIADQGGRDGAGERNSQNETKRRTSEGGSNEGV